MISTRRSNARSMQAVSSKAKSSEALREVWPTWWTHRATEWTWSAARKSSLCLSPRFTAFSLAEEKMSPEEFMKEYELSNQAHDLARVRSLIAADALFWFSNGTAHPGIERIADAIQQNFATIEDDHYEIGPVRWLVRADTCRFAAIRFDGPAKSAGSPRKARAAERRCSKNATADGSWFTSI